MLSNIGISGIVLIVIAAIVVFGPKKLPEIGRSFGKSLKEFRDATSGNPSATNFDEAQQPSTQTFSSATQASAAQSAEPHAEGAQSTKTQL